MKYCNAQVETRIMRNVITVRSLHGRISGARKTSQLQQGRRFASLVAAIINRLLHVNLDLPRFGFFRFGNAYLENAIFIGGFHAIRLGRLGQ